MKPDPGLSARRPTPDAKALFVGAALVGAPWAILLAFHLLLSGLDESPEWWGWVAAIAIVVLVVSLLASWAIGRGIDLFWVGISVLVVPLATAAWLFLAMSQLPI